MSAALMAAPKLDAASFQTIADLAYRESGLTLVKEKMPMIQSRLRHRLRALDMADFTPYCALLLSADGQQERQHLISALTTNVSHFFREQHHFDQLRDLALARLPALQAGGKLRLWSAGCANGQEALTAGIVLLEHLPKAQSLNIRLLATDIDREVVSFARRGQYPERMLTAIPAPLRAKYFTPVGQAQGGPVYAPCGALRDMIRFNELNLLGDWPIRNRFDVIFCRNVVIYFDMETQNRLWPRFHRVLSPEGRLFLGHSERITAPDSHGFACIAPTTYAPLPAPAKAAPH